MKSLAHEIIKEIHRRLIQLKHQLDRHTIYQVQNCSRTCVESWLQERTDYHRRVYCNHVDTFLFHKFPCSIFGQCLWKHIPLLMTDSSEECNGPWTYTKKWSCQYILKRDRTDRKRKREIEHLIMIIAQIKNYPCITVCNTFFVCNIMQIYVQHYAYFSRSSQLMNIQYTDVLMCMLCLIIIYIFVFNYIRAYLCYYIHNVYK